MEDSTVLSFTYVPLTPKANQTQIDPNAITFRYFGICVALYAIIVGCIGNLFTILAFVANKKLQTTFNIFVVNLSIVDFITSSLMLPFHLAGYVQMSWPFGNDSFTTRLQAFTYFCCGYTSVVFLLAITLNRFIGVFWPTKYNDLFRRKGMIVVLVFCWTFAPLCLLPSLIGTVPSCPSDNKALTGFSESQFLCTFRPICIRNGWKTYTQWIRVTFQFIPLGIMIVMYAAIFVKVHKKAIKMSRTISRGLKSPNVTKALSSTTSYSPGRAMHSTKKEHAKKPLFRRTASNLEQRRAENNRRMLLVSVVICIGFMITFLPSVIVNLLPGSKHFDVRVHMTASNLAWFNSALNPVIYVILNPRFRREYIRLLKMLFGKATGGFIHNSTINLHKSKSNDQQSTRSDIIKKNVVTE